MKIELIRKFNYIYFNRDYDTTHIKPFSPLLFFPRMVVKTIYHLCINLLYVSRIRNPAGKLVFYCRLSIDYDAFADVHREVKYPTLLVMEKKFKDFKEREALFPLSLSLIFSFFLAPLFILDCFRYFRKPEYISTISFRRGMEDIFMTYGRYAFMRLLFRFNRPSGVIVSNDHCYDTLIMIHLANQYKIPSIYIQHASVGDYFPKLETSLALLEGQDAQNVYLKRGSDPAKIRMVGMVKFDKQFGHINRGTEVKRIGIALNGLENLSTFHEDVIKIVEYDQSIKVIIRPHPILFSPRYGKEYREFVSRLKEYKNLEYSDSRTESPWSFLGRIDAQIAGDTSIHLEALLLNVYSIYYSNNPYYHSLDIYRFNRNQLIPFCSSPESVVTLIDAIRVQRPFVRSKAKYYCDTVDTRMDGKSLALACYYLENHMKSYPSIPSPDSIPV